MGLDLTYNADGVTFTHRFSHADWVTIEAIRGHLPDQIGICFDVPEPGESARIKSAALKQSALDLDHFLAENAQLLPATYQFKLECFPVPGVPVGDFATGGYSGLRLPNDPDHFYYIQAGLDQLLLQKWAARPGSESVIVEERDLRNERELITENAGKIQFRRRAAKTTLRQALRRIAAFADGVVSEELSKLVG